MYVATRFNLTFHVHTSIDQLEMRGYYTQLRMLVEEMYEESGEKVTIVVHSMGGPVTLHFLTSVVNQEWKDQYINAFVPLSGAWSGGNSALQAEVSGGDAGLAALVSPEVFSELRSAFRSHQSLVWLIPQPSVWQDTVLVTTPTRNYTANDYSDLFADISYPQGFEMYTGVTSINEGFPAPNVPVYCFYGTNVLTPESFVYNSSFPDVEPEIVFGDGDGTVNLLSSEVCLKWAQEQSQPFFSQSFPGVDHDGVVNDQVVLEAIENIVSSAGVVVTSVTVISIAIMFSLGIITV